jgi:histidyl-tRNA synthetase
MFILPSEREDLFRGNLGANSDVVIKEMFQLQDRSGEALALRPEGTMGALRSLSERQGHPLPIKV